MAIRLEEDPQNWDQAIIRVAFNAIIHPFEYAKLLIQVRVFHLLIFFKCSSLYTRHKP